MSISKENKKKLISEFSKNAKDNHSKRGLVALVNKRKKLLNYLSKKNKSDYEELIKKLNIRG